MVRLSRILAALAVVPLGGCFSPFTTRVPQITPRATEFERRASQVQDPFPDRDLGPDIDARPRDFQQQRPEVQRSKDRYYNGFLRSQQPQPFVQPQGVVPGP